MPKLWVQGKVLTELCMHRPLLPLTARYPRDRTVTTTETRKHMAMKRYVGEKDRENDEDTGKTGCGIMRAMGGADACGFTEPVVHPDELVESHRRSPNVTSPLGCALVTFVGIEDTPSECSDSATEESSSGVGSS